MEGVPATNRWPKWAQTALWVLLVLALLGAGMILREIPDDLMRLARLIGGNADRAEATQAFVLIVQTAIIVFGALYARQQVLSARTTSARTNTLQLIFEEHRDSTVSGHRAIYREMRDDQSDRVENYFDLKEFKAKIRAVWDERRLRGEIKILFNGVEIDIRQAPGDEVEREWRAYWDKHHKEKWAERRTAVSAVLNRYEAFAIGVEARAVDEDMYKKWWKTTLVEDWYVFRPLILKLQERNPRAYIEFQTLAERWQKETTKELRDAKRGKSTW